MLLEITYKHIYKTLPCPNNTVLIGVRLKHNYYVNSGLHLLFEGFNCKTHKEVLPDGTKIKFYFYTCEDKNILNILNNAKDITQFLFTQDYLQIKSINE